MRRCPRGYGTDAAHPSVRRRDGARKAFGLIGVSSWSLRRKADLERTPSVELVLELPDAIADLVRDALLHLYDPAQRQAHPLLSLVLGTASVDEAYALACRQHPVAILLDMVIPGRDGWELLLELKQRPSTREIPVITCSVLDEPAVAIALGAAAYLQKLIDQDRLLAR